MEADADALLAHAATVVTPAGLLRALLAAWNANPHPAIAALVDAAGEAALADRGPRIEETSLEDRHAQWLAVARECDPVDLAWLLPRMPTSHDFFMKQRMEALFRYDPDPRIAMALVGTCDARPLMTQRDRAVWQRLFRVLLTRLDARIAPAITALVALPATTGFELAQLVELRRVQRALTELAPRPPPAGMLAVIAERLGVGTAAKTAEDFLREIWARPRDDGPREVFADWLIERGDPRGELIALQLGRAAGRSTPIGVKRERALLAEHGRAWLGPLELAIGRTKLAFERGFVHRCDVRWRQLAALPELLTHPAWSTVREYHLAPEGERSCDAWLDHMIRLGSKRL